MRTPKTLLVYPNPWSGGLDHNERPKNAMPYPHDGTSGPTARYSRRWVGAVPAKDADGEQHFVFDCLDDKLELRADAKPIEVLNDVHQGPRFKQAILAGEILAADLRTWIEAGGKEEDFVEPAKQMAAEKAATLKAHEKDHGPHDPKPYSTWVEPSAAVAEKREGVPVHVKQAEAAAAAEAQANAKAAPQTATAAGGN